MANLPWTNKNCYNCFWWQSVDMGTDPNGHCRKYDEETDEYETCDEWEEKQ